ncbi:MAG: ABC transporter permease [Cytophaga sp.]|nr:ABC transporter permease [Cytophaga sp.]
MRKSWWKIVCVILLIYTVVGGFLFAVPRLNIVNETIRVLYFHVPMWFGMIALFLFSLIYAVSYLRTNKLEYDLASNELAHVGVMFGLLGIFSGMIWANYAWGSPWHGDAKQNGSAISTLAYLIYFVLRGSLNNEEQRARFSAVYNIFAFAVMIPLIFIYPRMVDSLHPGNGGNPGFNTYDLDSRMRMVFYPACIGWILLGFWIATIRIRARFIEETILDQENE